MPNPLILIAIGAVFGAGAGFLAGAGTSWTAPVPADEQSVHDHGAHDHGDGAHAGHHGMIEAEEPAPTLTLSLHPDGPQSRNLHIAVTHFSFAPEAVNGAHVPGQGHAHVYVNDIKIARAYGPWLHLDALPVGDHVIRVTLNTNDHAHLARGGDPIEAITTLTIPPKDQP